MVINSWITTIFDSLYDGILIIDLNEIVRYVNPAYSKITRVKYKDIVGKRLRDMRPGSRLQNVLIDKKPIVGVIREEYGIKYTVNMSPVIEDGSLIGAISVVSKFDDVYNLYKDIDKYIKKVKSLEKRMNAIQRAKYTLDDIISEDLASQEIKYTIKKISPKNTTILFYGESGTGKELYANAVHNESSRCDGPFIVINCASFQGTLLESELFGYDEGAFTGAKKCGKMGLFEAADKGTIFLDEISEMDLEVQARLLRTLQEGTIRRIGSVKETNIDVRVVAATNKNLEKMVNEGKFRQDLYYRISVFPLTIPPLRNRKRDILPLADHFLRVHKNEIKRDITISKDTEAALYNYEWPGNIRELKNAVEFSVNMMEDNIIRRSHLPKRIQQSAENIGTIVSKLSKVVKDAEKKEIYKALKIYGNDINGKRNAAKVLGISLASLYNKMK